MSATKSDKKFRLLIVAGEASGDQHAANLVRALRQTDYQFDIRGMGMQSMQNAGTQLIADATEIAVTGGTEVIRCYAKIRQRMKLLRTELRRHRPDLLILVDYPGFNLQLAKYAKRMDIKVLYYISPKIWAWNYRRIKKIKQYVDMLAVILPFEERLYRENRVPVRYVGHPLIDEAYTENILPYADIRRDDDRGTIRRILLLPGSRPNEIRQHLSLLITAAKRLKRQKPELNFSLLAAPGIPLKQIQEVIADNHLECVIEKNFYHAAKQTDFAIAASGTATLQLAICRIPMVIIYKPSQLTYWLAKMLMKIDYLGLPNILADKPIVKELVHHRLDAEQICRTVMEEISSPQRLAAMYAAFTEISSQLGNKGASKRLAELVCEMLTQHQPTRD